MDESKRREELVKIESISPFENTNKVMESLEKLLGIHISQGMDLERKNTLEILGEVTTAIPRKVVTSKRTLGNDYDIFVGGEYHNTLNTPFPAILELVVDAIQKAYTKGSLDTIGSIINNIKETKDE